MTNGRLAHLLDFFFSAQKGEEEYLLVRKWDLSEPMNAPTHCCSQGRRKTSWEIQDLHELWSGLSWAPKQGLQSDAPTS